jgi:uncharacterized membrane protein
MTRYVLLYFATLIVMIPVEFLFVGTFARKFLQSRVGDVLGDITMPPAIIFYLLYTVGILIFANGTPAASWQSAAIYGGLFGLFCYATFELSNMALLKQWSWAVVVVDIAWGIFVTASASALGLLLANWLQTLIGSLIPT